MTTEYIKATFWESLKNLVLGSLEHDNQVGGVKHISKTVANRWKDKIYYPEKDVRLFSVMPL